jgi:hypothetical protein
MAGSDCNPVAVQIGKYGKSAEAMCVKIRVIAAAEIITLFIFLSSPI